MLIALELAGFKSFAEKTRFDFPDGITVIVGPNGSGKSNVVDAIKWVLGAQSAKALRGKDMIDVIFKGSSSAGRKPSNSAEATLVFDNS
ncbi:MAG: AAA family ATPase, partial [Planctomycetota bacterium]